ncbi:B-cell receptor CD22-like [Centroberyx affinis]|uniref:B-cell receptor CD22-like n=1 Tax=Centroberyx affinis TaxID=166261 RepID=UPI003A5C6F69
MIQKTNAWTCRWLAFLALIRGFSCLEILFKIEDRRLTAKEGSCITINCEATQLIHEENEPWFWMKNAKWNVEMRDYDATIIYSNAAERQLHVSQDLAARVKYIGSPSFSSSSKNPTCSIVINNLQKTDSGIYSFRFDGNRKWKTEPGLNLTVEGNPCQIIFETPPVVKENGTVTLRCSTSSSCAYPQITGHKQIENHHTSVSKSIKTTTVSFPVGWQDDEKEMSCQTPGNTEDCLARKILLTVEYAPKRTSASMSPTDVKEGDFVTLTCSTRGRPNAIFSWYKDGQKQETSGAEWKIDFIEASHSGKYHCVAENEHGHQASNTLNIDVKYAPAGVYMTMNNQTITEDQEVKEGDYITLTCEVSRSNPNPKPQDYTWYKEEQPLWYEYEQPLELQQRDQSYIIDNIKPEDTGSYKCNASNSVGSGSSELHQIQVQYKPRSTVVFSSGSNNQVKVSHSLTLTCNTEAYPDPLSYSWYHNSSQWKANPTHEKTLHLTRFQDRGQAHTYFFSTDPPTRPVLSMVHEVREGQVITIGCTVESFPQSDLTLTWTSKSDPRSSTRWFPGSSYRSPRPNTLQVSFNVTSAHAGLYSCNAGNSEGSNWTEKELNVTYSPKNVMVVARDGTVVSENRELALHCKAQSFPPVTSYTWTKSSGGTDETVGQEETFTVQSVTPSHSGLYSCTATNTFGTGKSQQAEVKVEYAPKHTEIVVLNSSSQPDGMRSVVLSCRSHSFPPINRYLLYRIEDGDKHKFVTDQQNHTVYSNQSGNYYCIAENKIASKTSETLKVFLDRGFIKVLRFFIFSIIVLLVHLLFFLVYRRRRNKSIQQDEQGKLEYDHDYENISGAHAPMHPMPSNADTDTSEEEVELNYSGEVSFKAKPGHQRNNHHHNRGNSDDEDKTQYSEVKI